MTELPFDIPPSLFSYLEQYQSAPEKTTIRLEKQLQKRGADAVGYFLLAWFYHQQERHQQAVDYALKAKNYAPGSPFFENLHYFFSHPKLFDAWCNPSSATQDSANRYTAFRASGPLLDLDSLIEKLSDVESRRINFDPDAPAGTSKPDKVDDTDDIVSETLATIYEQQGKLEAAINAYERLKIIKSERKSAFDKKIKELKKIQKEQEAD